MGNKLFTIILAIHRSPEFLPLAVASVLAQQQDDFELFIVCDGAPQATADVANRLAKGDGRIQVRAHPKGERHGEIYRHQVLQETRGKYVAHIADDDLWMPNHLSELEKLLSDYDFGNLLHVFIDLDGVIRTHPYDLADPAVRMKMLTEKFNFFGPSVAGYRRSVYEQLPVGWSPAPEDLWADLYMWRKFLALPDIKVATRFAVTSVILPTTPYHGEKSVAERCQDMSNWLQVIQSPGGIALVQERLNHFFVREVMALDDRYNNSVVIRFADKLRNIKRKWFK